MRSRLVKAGADRRVPVTILDEEDRSAFALVLTLSFLQVVNTRLEQQAAQYIAKLDQLYLTGGPYQEEGKRKFSLALGVLDPNTSRVDSFMGLFVDYPH